VPASDATGEAVASAVWIIALIWMGSACILNARRCGRTHCRYTGPYYLVMIVPVLLLAAGWKNSLHVSLRAMHVIALPPLEFTFQRVHRGRR
jgi:Ca2+/Na+ antiporter